VGATSFESTSDKSCPGHAHIAAKWQRAHAVVRCAAFPSKKSRSNPIETKHPRARQRSGATMKWPHSWIMIIRPRTRASPVTNSYPSVLLTLLTYLVDAAAAVTASRSTSSLAIDALWHRPQAHPPSSQIARAGPAKYALQSLPGYPGTEAAVRETPQQQFSSAAFKAHGRRRPFSSLPGPGASRGNRRVEAFAKSRRLASTKSRGHLIRCDPLRIG